MGGAKSLGVLAAVAALSMSEAPARAEGPPAAPDAGVVGAPTRGPARAWKPLRSASASATSFLQNNWNRFEENYHPSYVLDGNPATAWVEGVPGFGEGEALTIPVSALRRARAVRLRIWNGYQKSMHLWTKNGMPQKVRVTVLDAAGEEVASSEPELARALGPQEVVVEIPSGRGVGAVKLTILSVYEGQRYDDTCISDILVDVDSDVRYNAAVENAKRAALQAWIDGRKETAAYFAAKPPEFPFAATKYAEARSSVDAAEFKKRFAARDPLLKTLGAERFKPGAKDLVRAIPDGLAEERMHIEDFAQLLKLDRVALMATTDATVSARTLQEGMQKVWTTSARVAREGDGKAIRALAFDIKDVTTERTSWTYNRSLLLVYDGQGRLETLYRSIENLDEEAGEDYETVSNTDEIWTFSYDAAGKLQTLDRSSLERHHRIRDKRATKERESKHALRIVYTGLPEKSS
jgi:hypothetical protein